MSPDTAPGPDAGDDPALAALLDDVRNRLSFHPATPVTGPLHDAVRRAYLELAETVARTVPRGRHQSLALTALQESMMWANAGVACDTRQVPE